MHYQVLMCVLNGGTDRTKQSQAGSRTETPDSAIICNGLTLDILQHEIRQAIGGSTAIEQPGDVRVLQPRQDLALNPKLVDGVIGISASLDDRSEERRVGKECRSWGSAV